MKKFLLASLLVLVVTLGANAQAPQYGRYYKTLTQSSAPTQPCQIGTLIFNTTTKTQYVCGLSNIWYQTSLSNSGTLLSATLPILSSSTVTVSQGVSPSYKQIYGSITIPASVVGGTQNFKAVQGWSTLAAGSAPAEVWGVYGTTNNSGTPISAYGVTGEIDNTAGAPTGAAFGVVGTYDGVTSVTALPGATGLFSAAVAGQVWDRNTTGPTAIFLALDNGDVNRQAANPIGAAFKAINRHISFATGFNYGLDLAIDTPFVRGALVADIRLGGKQEIYWGAATTRNAVRTQVSTQGSIGSLYLSSAGKLYLKVAIAGADTDWERVTTTAAD